MDKKKAILIWIAMAIFIGLIAYLIGAPWYGAIIIGILSVAAIVGIATGTVYWKQKKLIQSALQFDIDLKSGKINPANLRRMYFTGGQARKDALFIASQAMRCSVQEAEKQLSSKITREAAQREMSKINPSAPFKGRPR